MKPPKDAGKQVSSLRCGGGENVREGKRNWHPGDQSKFVQPYFTGMQAKVGYHKGGHQKEDEKGIQGGFNVRGTEKDFADYGDHHACQNHQGHNIGHEEQDTVRYGSYKVKREAGEDAGNEKLCIDQRQNHKTPEEQKVVNPKLFANYPKLDKGIEKHPFKTRPEMVEPVVPPSQADHSKESKNVSEKETEATCKQNGKY